MILGLLIQREVSLQYSEDQTTLMENEIIENYDEIVASIEAKVKNAE